jgi:MinD superfamily P-loop ATPase
MKQITVISGKGGTGKTSLTSALASVAENSVFADCDVDAADLHLIMNPEVSKEEVFPGSKKVQIDPEECIRCGLCKALCRYDAVDLTNNIYSVREFACEACDLCRKACPVDAIYINQSMTSRWFTGNTRFGEMVYARLGIGEELSGKLVAKVRDEAKAIAKEKQRDYIIVDGPPGIGCAVIASITGVDDVLVITEPTQSGLHDLDRVVSLARQFNARPSVVLNKYDLNTKVAAGIENYCRENDIKVVGRIDYDPVFTEAMVNRKSVVEYAPDSKAAAVIKTIWESIR